MRVKPKQVRFPFFIFMKIEEFSLSFKFQLNDNGYK